MVSFGFALRSALLSFSWGGGRLFIYGRRFCLAATAAAAARLPLRLPLPPSVRFGSPRLARPMANSTRLSYSYGPGPRGGVQVQASPLAIEYRLTGPQRGAGSAIIHISSSMPQSHAVLIYCCHACVVPRALPTPISPSPLITLSPRLTQESPPRDATANTHTNTWAGARRRRRRGGVISRAGLPAPPVPSAADAVQTHWRPQTFFTPLMTFLTWRGRGRRRSAGRVGRVDR